MTITTSILSLSSENVIYFSCVNAAGYVFHELGRYRLGEIRA